MNTNRLRIHNDYTIVWSIMRGELPEDFTGKDVAVELLDPLGRKSDISYTIEANKIKIFFAGKDQQKVGPYNAVLYEHRGELGMVCINHQEVLTLVQNSEEVGGEGCSNVEVIPQCDITGCITVPDRGASAYEIAVAQGFAGSVDEWLASLKGEKGDKGDDGSCIFPKFSVNSEMELIIDTELSTDRFSVEDGCLMIKM